MLHRLYYLLLLYCTVSLLPFICRFFFCLPFPSTLPVLLPFFVCLVLPSGLFFSSWFYSCVLLYYSCSSSAVFFRTPCLFSTMQYVSGGSSSYNVCATCVRAAALLPLSLPAIPLPLCRLVPCCPCSSHLQDAIVCVVMTGRPGAMIPGTLYVVFMLFACIPICDDCLGSAFLHRLLPMPITVVNLWSACSLQNK